MIACLEQRGPKPVGELSKHVAQLMRRGGVAHASGGGAGDASGTTGNSEVLTPALKHQYNGGIKRFIEAQARSVRAGLNAPRLLTLNRPTKHLSHPSPCSRICSLFLGDTRTTPPLASCGRPPCRRLTRLCLSSSQRMGRPTKPQTYRRRLRRLRTSALSSRPPLPPPTKRLSQRHLRRAPVLQCRENFMGLQGPLLQLRFSILLALARDVPLARSRPEKSSTST